MYRKDVIVTSLPDPKTVDQVIVDCTQVEFIDSSFITQLMRYRRDFMQSGGDPFNIVIVVSPQIRRIFDVTGISGAMTLVTAKSKEPS